MAIISKIKIVFVFDLYDYIGASVSFAFHHVVASFSSLSSSSCPLFFLFSRFFMHILYCPTRRTYINIFPIFIHSRSYLLFCFCIFVDYSSSTIIITIIIIFSKVRILFLFACCVVLFFSSIKKKSSNTNNKYTSLQPGQLSLCGKHVKMEIER